MIFINISSSTSDSDELSIHFMIDDQPYHESQSQSQQINEKAPFEPQQDQQQQQPAEPNQEFQNMNVNQQQRPTVRQIRKRKKARGREVREQEANEFLQQPVVKIINLNKDLKRAYEKSHFDESKYDFIKTLRKKRRHPEQDSVSSHYNSDESWDIRDALPKRGFQKKKDDILSSSDSGQEKPQKKRGPKPRDPSQPKKVRQPRKLKQPKQPREPREPRKPRQTKIIKEPIKKEEEDKVKQEKQFNLRIKTPLPEAEPRKSGVTIKITKAPPGMNWDKDGNNHAKRKASESEASLNESESSFKTSSGDESEQKIIAEHLNKNQPKVEEKKGLIKQIRAQKEVLPIPQPKIQEKTKREEQVEKKPISSVPLNVVPKPKQTEPQESINGHLKNNDERARTQVKKSLKLQSNSMSNSSSSEQSSSSSSSSDSSSESSDEESKSMIKKRHKHKKRRYSSSDSSSEQKKSSKKHKNKKRHRKDHSQKPSESLITKVVQQQLNLPPKEQSLMIGKNDKNKKEVIEQHLANKKESLIDQDSQRISKKVQLVQKETLIERDTVKQSYQNQANSNKNLSGGIVRMDIEDQKIKVSEKETSKLDVQSIKPNEGSAEKIEQEVKQPSSFIIKTVQSHNEDRPETLLRAYEKQPIENLKKLKPILKEVNSQTIFQAQSLQAYNNKNLKKPQAKEGNQLTLKSELVNEKKQKQLTLDNKVVVLQLMIGSSEREKQHVAQEPLVNETQKIVSKQSTAKRNGQKTKQVGKIRDYSSDESEEVTQFSKPMRPSYIPQKVVRYRKVIVESSDDTQSSQEYIRDRRVIRRVRKPVKYQSSVTSSEDEAIDYRVVTYRGKDRREQYDYRGYR